MLGLAQYCERAAIPNMAKLVHPLRKLLKKNVPFILTDELRAVLKEFKENIVKYAMGYFRKDWVNKLIIDASPMGLGLVHTQYNPKNPSERHIVDLGSRTLSETEAKYHQTELEALALVWAIEKRHYYLYNVEFEVVTDNKAVQLIYGKPNSVQKGRIQRWGLRLRPYRFKIIHQEGLNNIADFLSRHSQPIVATKYEREAEEHVNLLTTAAIPKSIKRSELAKMSKVDARIQNVINMLNNKAHTKDDVFKKLLNELTVTKDGLLLRGGRVVVPKSLQKVMVKIAHRGHQGMAKTKRLARRHIWFARMDSLIEKVVKDCPSCKVNTKSRSYNPVKSTKMPLGPWRQLAIDYYGPVWGKYVLVLIDYFSRYPLAKILFSTNSKSLLPYLDEVFSMFGIPKSIKSDNGPPFNSKDFADFCERNNIQHNKITPYWPRANGLVENFMKNLTKCIKNSKESGIPFEEILKSFLRDYRATPHSTTGEPPNDLLFRPKPSTTGLPNSLGDDEIVKRARSKDEIEKAKQAKRTNAKLKAKQHEMKIGDNVLLLQTVAGKATTVYDPAAYSIVDVKGSMITIKRGNRVLARDSSLLKRIDAPIIARPLEIESIFVEDDAEEEAQEASDGEEQHQRGDMQDVQTPGPQPRMDRLNLNESINRPQATPQVNRSIGRQNNETRRSTRNRRAPDRFDAGRVDLVSESVGADESLYESASDENDESMSL